MTRFIQLLKALSVASALMLLFTTGFACGGSDEGTTNKDTSVTGDTSGTDTTPGTDTSGPNDTTTGTDTNVGNDVNVSPDTNAGDTTANADTQQNQQCLAQTPTPADCANQTFHQKHGVKAFKLKLPDTATVGGASGTTYNNAIASVLSALKTGPFKDQIPDLDALFDMLLKEGKTEQNGDLIPGGPLTILMELARADLNVSNDPFNLRVLFGGLKQFSGIRKTNCTSDANVCSADQKCDLIDKDDEDTQNVDETFKGCVPKTICPANVDPAALNSEADLCETIANVAAYSSCSTCSPLVQFDNAKVQTGNNGTYMLAGGPGKQFLLSLPLGDEPQVVTLYDVTVDSPLAPHGTLSDRPMLGTNGENDVNYGAIAGVLCTDDLLTLIRSFPLPINLSPDLKNSDILPLLTPLLQISWPAPPANDPCDKSIGSYNTGIEVVFQFKALPVKLPSGPKDVCTTDAFEAGTCPAP